MKYVFAFVFSITFHILWSQTTEHKLYDPTANAENDLKNCVKKAQQENKHVLVQIGGNWCKWCIEFNRFCNADTQIDSLLKADFIVYHLNYSKENKNEKTLESFGFPQRFGFPVFIVLDEKGNKIHTQNSSYLEEKESYSKSKVMEFLKQWNRKSLAAETYLNKK
jgi:thioredoxin-related protein